jgi:hypothetical protein
MSCCLEDQKPQPFKPPRLFWVLAPFDVSKTLKLGVIRPLIVVSGFRAGKRAPGRFPMTIFSEHHRYGTDRVVERLAIVAIVISGVAATVVWFYLLW